MASEHFEFIPSESIASDCASEPPILARAEEVNSLSASKGVMLFLTTFMPAATQKIPCRVLKRDLTTTSNVE